MLVRSHTDLVPALATKSSPPNVKYWPREPATSPQTDLVRRGTSLESSRFWKLDGISHYVGGLGESMNIR